METKECGLCGGVFELAGFSKNAAKEDGLSVWCRGCVKEYTRVRREEISGPRPADWKKKTADQKEYLRKYRISHPEYEKGKYERRKARLAEKRLAEGWVRARPNPSPVMKFKTVLAPEERKRRFWIRRKVKQAVVRGKLVKLPCLVCGKAEVEAHHPDYDQPMSVVWLCRQHHREIHDGALSHDRVGLEVVAIEC